MNSQGSKRGVAALAVVFLCVFLCVFLFVGVIVGVLVSRRPAPDVVGTTSNTASSLTCQHRVSFVMADAGASLFSVAAASPQEAWAVGVRGTQATILHWDGQRWAATALPALGATSSSLTAVAVLGPGDAWAVGRADLGPLILHWDGTAWARVVAAPDGAYSGLLSALVIGGGPTDIWALGSVMQTRSSTPHTLAEHWDGRAWRMARTPPGRTIISATSGPRVSGAGPAIIVATASVNTQYLARWDGQAWRQIPAPAGMDLQAVATGADGALWAAGSYWPQGANWAAPILERWDGSVWSPAEVSQPEARGAWLTSLAIGSDGSVWAAGMLRNPNTRLNNAFVAHVDEQGKAKSTGGGYYPAVYTDPHRGDAFVVTSVAAMPGADEAWLVGTTGSAPDPSLPPIDSNLPAASGAFVLQDC